MLASELDFDLPPRLIATHPVEPRDACKLLVVSRSDPSRLEHRAFRDLPDLLSAADLLIFNTSAVLPAKIQGVRADSGGAVEGLFVQSQPASAWLVMLRSNSRLRPGQRIRLHDAANQPSSFELRLIERQDAMWIAAPFTVDGAASPLPPADILRQVGATPLPPYIRKARLDPSPARSRASDSASRGARRAFAAISRRSGRPTRCGARASC